MVKIKNSLSSKLLSMLLAFSILIGMVPPAIVSAYASSNGSVGTVVEVTFYVYDHIKQSKR